MASRAATVLQDRDHSQNGKGSRGAIKWQSYKSIFPFKVTNVLSCFWTVVRASNRSTICVNVSLSTSGFESYTSVTSICYVSRVPSPASAISLALTTAPSAKPHMLAITPYHREM